jgi:hypothetical protein
MPTVDFDVKVTLFKGKDNAGNDQYSLDIDPLTVFVSPLDINNNNIRVVWKLEVVPPNAVLPTAELVVFFKEGATPFNSSNSGNETYTTNAGSPNGAPSGPVRPNAVGGAHDPDDPVDQHVRPYDYTVKVNIKDAQNNIILSPEIDPTVLVRRRRVRAHKVWA